MNFAPTLSDQINAAIDAGLQAENAKQPKRTYLGASEIGEECERRLAYSFHGVERDPFPGRIIRRFRLGQMHEDETVAWLRGAGFNIKHSQAGFSLAGGRFKGHIDGVAALGGPIVLPYPLLFEHKIMKESIWKAFVKHGVQKEHPRYYGQIQTYMRQFSLGNTLFAAINTNTSETHFELISYNSAAAEEYIEKAARILTSKDPLELPRIAITSTDFRCNFCPYKDRCWAPPKVSAAKPMWMR